VSIKNRKGYVNVRSIIQGIGDWELDTGVTIPLSTPGTRQGYVDFSKAVLNSKPDPNDPDGWTDPTPPFPSNYVYIRFLSQASRVKSMLALVNGEMIRVPLIIGFDYPSGTRYRIHMTPNSDAVYPYPLTDYVDTTCTGVDASGCNRWQIRPDGFNGGCATADCSVLQNRVKLIKVVTSKGRTTEIDQGDFYMSFSIDIAKQ
jgi:hypothetical protein